jgi:hypothetical protein
VLPIGIAFKSYLWRKLQPFVKKKKGTLSSSFVRETLLRQVLVIYWFLNRLCSYFTLQTVLLFRGKNPVSSHLRKNLSGHLAAREAKKPWLSGVSISDSQYGWRSWFISLAHIMFQFSNQTPAKSTKLRRFSLQASYTDRATAACRRSYCQLLRIEGVAWSAQRIPMAVNLSFLDRAKHQVPWCFSWFLSNVPWWIIKYHIEEAQDYLTVYSLTRIQEPICSSSSFIDVKPNAICNFLASLNLFYLLQKKNSTTIAWLSKI